MTNTKEALIKLFQSQDIIRRLWAESESEELTNLFKGLDNEISTVINKLGHKPACTRWHMDDVTERAKQYYCLWLDDSESTKILNQAYYNHDCNQGITMENIDDEIEKYIEKRKRKQE